jgi:NADPH:quinone reductase-like Zn-dependent oxidoreductase
VTAWHALFRAGRPILAGNTVLVLGTGGVSVAALQLASAAGARVIATSSSDEKLARVRVMGASELINYRRTPDWEHEVRRLTAGRGVDCVVEVGGAGTLARSMKSLARGGKVALIGFLAGRDGDTNPTPLMMTGGSLHGIFVGDREMFEEMNRAIVVNGITPVVDRVFPFEDALAAYRYHASGACVGKVVIAV